MQNKRSNLLAAGIWDAPVAFDKQLNSELVGVFGFRCRDGEYASPRIEANRGGEEVFTRGRPRDRCGMAFDPPGAFPSFLAVGPHHPHGTG